MIRFMNPDSPVCPWTFWETWTSEPREEMYILGDWRAERWGCMVGDHGKAVPLATPTTYLVICQGEKLSAAGMIDRAGPVTGCVFLLKGASSCESLIPHKSAMNHRWSGVCLGPPTARYRLICCYGQEIWESSIVIKLLLIWLLFF